MMFSDLVLESEERRTNAPAAKVEPTPEMVDFIARAWQAQKEAGEKALGHKVKVGADHVEDFHVMARAACNAHEPRLKYRKLSQVGKDKSPEKAYFLVALWPTKDDAEVGEAPESETEPESTGAGEVKPSRTRRTAK